MAGKSIHNTGKACEGERIKRIQKRMKNEKRNGIKKECKKGM